ncbi:ATP synthase mitochondrial F1 complex assembly factor 2-like [Rhopilema esculentum]|uniref:ATP synthase mitochondrial F1 complex assembly factor 2-like n=1 Tax=Rhopilema esculentum TaxID=499914 RepID=UPI0031CFFCCC
MNAKGLQKLLISTTKAQQRLLNKKFLSYIRTKQRFYKNVTINEDKGKYFIQLDGKNVKTPLRNDLYAPTQKLASIVASEWSSQKQTILAHQMHMTSLCNTCIDNPRKRTKEDMIHDALSFLNSDTLCARTPIEESEHTAKMQSEKWDPVLHWFSKRFDVEIVSSTDIFGFEQPEMTMLKMKQYLSKLSRWQLEGLEFSVDSVKSFIIPFAVIENYTTINEAIYLARLEVNLQIEKWGSVEWYHDIEKENQLAHMSAGVLFYQLCSESFDDEL